MGHRLNVPPDPPAISQMAVLETTVETSINVPEGEFTNIGIPTIASTLTAQFGLPPSSYSVGVLQAKVWLMSINQKLTVQFYDVNSDHGVLLEVVDWGAPTRFSAAGFSYPISDAAEASAAAMSKANLLSISHSLSEAARVLIRFNVRLRLKSLAGT